MLKNNNRFSREEKQRISKYKQEFIGKGGFSQVYRISDLVVEKRLYNKDPKSKKRFIQEIDLIS
ncbi:hypothetical protein ABWL48_14975, partial [Streptococcus suis]